MTKAFLRAIIQLLNSMAESKIAMKEKEGTGGLRELELLEALAKDPEARQVDLATRLGVAVGTVNWLLKRLTFKGYVKVKRIGQWQWHYLLTPRGFAEKARLTQRYLKNSMHLYRKTRQEARRLLGALRERGYAQVYLEGDQGNDLLDVCRLTCLEQEIAIAKAGNPLANGGVPTLRVVGQELTLAWPQGKAPSKQGEQGWKIDQRLSEVIERIIEVAQPEKIILFGSAARGEMGPNSDFDLLVVKPGDYHRGHLTEEIYMRLFGVGQAVDVVVVTPEDIERYRDSHSLVIKPALQEGKVVYEHSIEATSAG